VSCGNTDESLAHLVGAGVDSTRGRCSLLAFRRALTPSHDSSFRCQLRSKEGELGARHQGRGGNAFEDTRF
jgi:hypothetical protein